MEPEDIEVVSDMLKTAREYNLVAEVVLEFGYNMTDYDSLSQACHDALLEWDI